MDQEQASDYLAAKSDALRFVDKEDSRGQGMKQFLDDKTYRPGFGAFKRAKAKARVGRMQHDPEKARPGLDPGWIPIFGKDHAQTKN